ncbi:MAG: winged helix DNA-binding domain-containing protein, partial [Acidimicrobiia bacterium]
AVVGRLAGLQAQHANAPYVALWSRRRDQTLADLEAALVDRSVVKATIMRSTLHLVAASDFWAFDAACSPGRVGVWSATARRVGVDLLKLNAVLIEFCREPRTVAEMEAHLAETFDGRLSGPDLVSGVRNSGFRMASAAGGLVHVPPSGLWKSHRRPSYQAARSWLGDDPELSSEAGLATAVERYLGAYGPASEGDILKWLGERRVTKLRAAVQSLEDRVAASIGHDDRQLVDLAELAVPGGDIPAPVRFLSRWDSVLIAYDVRDRILPDEYRSAVIKKNGDFLPTFLVDGFVAGLWSVEENKGDAVLRIESFAKVPAADRRALKVEGEELVRYVAPEAHRHGVAWAT